MEKGHGRIETRKIAVSREVVPYLAWPGLAQVARIERRREIARKASTEIVYLITSLPPEAASPQRLLRLARDHWGIENRLHYVRDVAFAEDRCRVRAGARPLASLRNFAITLIRRAGLSIFRSPRELPRRSRQRHHPRDRASSLNDPGSRHSLLSRNR